MKAIITIAAHDYGHHCQRSQNIPGTTAGQTRYEELCIRRIESFCASPEDFDYNLKGEKTITAYVLRFTETDPEKEKNGRQLVTQTFKIAKDTKVPPLYDESWQPFKGTEKLVGFKKDYYKKNADKYIHGKYQPCFDKKKFDKKDYNKDFISALHLYWLINDIRVNHTNQAVFEISVFSHSYSGGPILANSFQDQNLTPGERDPLDYDMRASDIYSDAGMIIQSEKYKDTLILQQLQDSINALNLKIGSDTIYYSNKIFFPDPVYGGAKNDLQRNLEKFPSKLNLITEDVFTNDASFRIWGCNANKLQAIIVETFADSKSTSAYPPLLDNAQLANLDDEKKDYLVYHKLSVSTSSMWDTFENTNVIDLVKTYLKVDKDDDAALNSWIMSVFSVVNFFPMTKLLLNGVLAYYIYLANKGKKVGTDRFKFICDKMYAALKPGKGTLTLYINKNDLTKAIFHSGVFGLMPAAIYGIDCHFAPPGTQGLYQEERIYPPLSGITEKYPIHEIARGHLTKSGIKNYKYKSFNPRTGKSSVYNAPIENKLMDFYFNELGFSLDGDGYLQVTQFEALNLLVSNPIKFF